MELLGTLGDIVGYRAGLALSQKRLETYVRPFSSAIMRSGNTIRIRAETYDELVLHILKSVGNIPESVSPYPFISLYHKYKSRQEELAAVMQIVEQYCEFVKSWVERKKGPIDLGLFIIDWTYKHRAPSEQKLLFEVLNDILWSMHANPWGDFRAKDWSDVKDLDELFQSESLKTNHGRFFDQRFIDFLHKNFGTIDQINWRKFEALTCEFFARAGFHVQIGRGRGDGNIDARIWPKRPKEGDPPAIIVQCKRQRETVGKVVVKALWADIQDESAQSGLIATTSRLSIGAEAVCKARSYPITQANRQTMRKWVQTMRTPHTGVLFGE